MISEIKKALQFAKKAHEGQLRAIGPDAGLPYFDTHVVRVVRAVPDWAKAAAALHDVVEDTDATMADLENAGFELETLDAVEFLTHQGGPYEDYIEKMIFASNHRALTVKAADLMDNLSTLPEGSKRKTYLKALHRVTGALIGF